MNHFPDRLNGHDSRARYRDALMRIEGEERFEGLQNFFSAVQLLTSERRRRASCTWSRNPRISCADPLVE